MSKIVVQLERCCRVSRIRHFSNKKIVILDNVKYLTLYDADNFNNASDNVKYEEKTEVEDNSLVWCAISLARVLQPCVGHVEEADIHTYVCLNYYVS